MKSRLYQGTLRHRRLQPRPHAFSYRVFMPYLCLDELPELLDGTPFWSARGRALAEFRRSDFLGDPAVPLAEAVRARICAEGYAAPAGPVYLLANLRYFGKAMNPLTCYYCFNRDESQLEYLVAEVTNTPWNERHSYVLPGPGAGKWLRTEFAKEMHVSPFNPMNMQYRWRSSRPGDQLSIHLENWQDADKIFDATLQLEQEPLTGSSLNRALWRYPFMSARVGVAIYWQALKLFLKGVPIHPHPQSSATGVHHE